ncbi:MAG: choice-of-anchor B family protein [Saprospiraceae bacterium]|nr:choice-of-anchor B family protein [Saprospiraceae bacterium]
MSLVGSYEYNVVLSNIWGYAAPDGTEYALVGTDEGVSIVSLSDPSNPVETELVPGPASNWREIKTWGNYAYASNETGAGLLVIDLSNLPGPVTYQYLAPNIPGLGILNTIHTLSVDENGFLFLNGTNLNNGGMLFMDLNADPFNPIYVGKCAPVYSHDSYIRDNLAYSFEIYAGVFSIYDVTDKSNPVLLASQQTGGNFTHNGWLSDDSKILFTTDEVANAPVGAYDVSDPNNIIELDQFRPFATLGTGVIPHNAHVWDDYVIVSYYTDGCIILDGSRPGNLVEIANFDTFFPSNTGFDGAWGAYPYLPSGLVLVSDINNGLFVLQPNYVRACHLEGKVTDATTGLGLNGATIELTGTLTKTQSDLVGNYKTGIATSGTYTVTVKKPGYENKTVSAILTNGQVVFLDIALQSLPTFSISGTVTEEGTGLPIPDAKVQIKNSDFSFDLATGTDGKFFIQQFYNGDYDVFAGKWGYKTGVLTSQQVNNTTGAISLSLEKGYEDIFSLDLGWTVNGDATQGIWERGEPIEVFPPQVPFAIQPGMDAINDAGNSCYFTGNVADLFSGVQINGFTRLVSPPMDLSGMNEPYIKFFAWIFSACSSEPALGNDKLIVKITNGTETATIQQVEHASLFFPPTWNEYLVDVSNNISLDSPVQIIFEVGDIDPGFVDVVESGVDFFEAFDADPPSNTNENVDIEQYLTVSPNPSIGEFRVKYDLFEFGNQASKLLVFNTLGQLVETHPLIIPSGTIAVGKNLKEGVYYLNISTTGKLGEPIMVIKH